MTLPPEILQAAASAGGGKLALVLGAGCSVEPPTDLPMSAECSLEIHRRLVADGILGDGDCKTPEDLSALADAVYGRRGSQREVVERFLDRYNLKLASANEGYKIAAALLSEGVISSIVTLNYDLALSSALSMLGAEKVGVIERPEDLPRQKAVNVYYLHRNANAEDPELWVLRTVTLNEQWKGHWESIIATKVLTAPVIIFAGLGSPIAVLLETIGLLQKALPAKFYLADPSDAAKSPFSLSLKIDSSHYLQITWGDLMRGLAARVIAEQNQQLSEAAARKVKEDGLGVEDIDRFLKGFVQVGIVHSGIIRAEWLLNKRAYEPMDSSGTGLIADLLLALAMIVRVSGASATILDDGRIEFKRDGRIVTTIIPASGKGHRNRLAIETDLKERRKKFSFPPIAALVAGEARGATPAPPEDIVGGQEASDDILLGPTSYPLFYVADLRNDQKLIQQVVP